MGILRQRCSGTSSHQLCSFTTPLLPTPCPGALCIALFTPHGHSEVEVHTHTPAWVGIVLGPLPLVYVTTYTSPSTINKGLADLLTYCSSLAASSTCSVPLSQSNLPSWWGYMICAVIWGQRTGDSVQAAATHELSDADWDTGSCWAENPGEWVTHSLALSTIPPLALVAAFWKSNHQEMSNPPREGAKEHETRGRRG